MKKQRKIRYYSSFNEDFEKTKNQDYKLRENYKWIRTRKSRKLFDNLLYGFAWLVSGVWCRLFLRMRVHKSPELFNHSGGGFIYANHTQPVGDVFMPAHTTERRIRTVVSPSNLGIPVIGKLLPSLGALPIPSDIKRLRLLEKAIEKYISEDNIIAIYPEGHVWEYYSGVRDFSKTAFGYPVKMQKASYSLTTVYKKTKYRKKPKMHLYIDGPFYPDCSLPFRERAGELCDRIHKRMEERCKEGDCEYIKYIFRSEKSE
ncbi:MAG: 1-acyl-sn-glycerol-3-phosphate acyltransferase [Clostridia bacterium]|nr:1-acyl-sn-glycerol-3-phosphate acyltransferase [Clostridia bacterium]